MAALLALMVSRSLGAAETPEAQATPAFLADSLQQLDGAPTAFKTPDLLPTLINLILSLGVVVVLIYLVYWGLRRWQATRGLSSIDSMNSTAINVLEKNFLDARRGVAVVEIGEEIYYLGLGDNVTVLGIVSDADAIDKIKAMVPPQGGFAAFPQQMEKVATYLRRDQWQKSRDTLRNETEALKAKGQRVRAGKNRKRTDA